MPHVALLGPRPPHHPKTRATVWTFAVVLAFIYFVAGATKLLALPFHVESFQTWGYPLWSMYLVGVIEVVLAFGLLMPAIRFWAAGLLAVEMLGAIFTHLQAGQVGFAIVPFLLMLANGLVAWIDRPYRVRKAAREAAGA